MEYMRLSKERREEPVVCCCGRDENLRPGVTCGPVIRDVYIVECCTAGYGSAVINGKEFSVRPGDCYFLMPGDTIIHTADLKNPRSGVWCAIDGLQIGQVFAKAGITSEAPYAPAKAFEEITAQVEQMVQMQQDTDPGAELRRTACIYGVLGALLRHSSRVDSDVWVQKAIGLMEAQYFQPITIGWMAEQVGLERSYFSTLFKSHTGKTPHAYLMALRIQKACVLMKEHRYSVTAAAEAVGLDSRNFARLFKRETGKTPREYIAD